MVVTGYIIEQAAFLGFFSAMLLLSALQLLVERKAIYDAMQLTAQERLKAWREQREQRKNSRASSITGLALPPTFSPPARTATQSTDADAAREHSLSKSFSSKLKPRTRRAEPLCVGKIQWIFHRLAFLSSVLNIIRFVDPYAVYGVYDLLTTSFLSLNISAVSFSAATISLLIPIHLVRVAAFHERSRRLEYLAGSIAAVTFVLANLCPSLFHFLGAHPYQDVIFLGWIAFALLVLVIVFDVSMHRLRRAFAEVELNLRDKQRHKPYPNSPQAVSPVISKPRTVSEASLASAAPLSSSEAAPITSDLSDPSNPLPPQTTSPKHQRTASDGALLSVLSQSLLSASPSVTEPSLSALNPLVPASSDVRPLSPKSPAASDRSASLFRLQYSPPPVDARDKSPSDNAFSRTMRHLTVFQLIVHALTALFEVAAVLVCYKNLKDDKSSFFTFDENQYSSAATIAFVVIHALVVATMLWYAYMPISVLWTKFDDDTISDKDTDSV